MKKVQFKLLDVLFEKKEGNLLVSIEVPVDKVHQILGVTHKFRKRIQFFPGMAHLYHYIVLIEEAVIGVLEGK